MATATKVAGLPLLPAGYTVIEKGGKAYAQKKKRTRRRYKLSKAQRQKISTAAKKFRLPVLTIGANIVPIFGAFDFITNIMPQNLTPNHKVVSLWNRTIKYYTGITLTLDGQGNPAYSHWRLGDAALGLGPNIILGAVKGAGMFRNQRRQAAKASGGLISAT